MGNSVDRLDSNLNNNIDPKRNPQPVNNPNHKCDINSSHDPNLLTYIDKAAEQLTERANLLLQIIEDIKYKQFHEDNISKIENEMQALIKDSLYYFNCMRSEENDPSGDKPVQSKMFCFRLAFRQVAEELKKLHIIFARLKVSTEIREMKQRLFALSSTDTCMKYVEKLDNDAKKLQAKLEKCKEDVTFADLYNDLEFMLTRIEAFKKNTKKQVILESVTGVLTLGTSAATAVVGAVGVAAKASTTMASGVKSASTATSVVVDGVEGVSTLLKATNIVVNVSRGAGIMTSVLPFTVNAGLSSFRAFDIFDEYDDLTHMDEACKDDLARKIFEFIMKMNSPYL